MKKLSILLSISLMMALAFGTSCNSQTSQADQKTGTEAVGQEGNTVTVYYYHGDRRCITCKAVGSVSKQTIAEAFEGNANVIYKDLNIDDPANNELKDKFELSGSGLFVYNEVEKEDLTVLAFQKAMNSPEELKEKIIATVKEML